VTVEEARAHLDSRVCYVADHLGAVSWSLADLHALRVALRDEDDEEEPA
jgi:hypothetical protein